MVLKSKQILSATLIIALAAAVAVNWYYTNNPELSQKEETTINQEVSGNLGDSLYVGATTANTEEETTQSETTESSADSEEYFSQAKLKRTNAHDQIIDNIEDIIENEELSQADKSKITVMLSDFQADIKCETDTENLIKAKTGSECLVTINNSNCQVILEKNTLNDRLILQITEIIEKNTNISAENLTIIELK